MVNAVLSQTSSTAILKNPKKAPPPGNQKKKINNTHSFNEWL